MSSRQDSTSKQESFIYERVEGPDHSFTVRQHKVIKRLGKGGFAEVYKIVRLSDQKDLAIKVIKKEKGGTKYSQLKIQNEVAIMKKLKHPNIVEYFSHFQDAVDFNIVMEVCQNGSYQQMLKKRQTLSQPQMRYYLLQFASILKYLQNQFVIHRDIKPANFFIDSKMNIKLGDFGLATFVDTHFLNSKRHTCGTPNYIAPEILLKQKYMYEIDVWSVGVLIYASLYGRPPFQTKQKKVQSTYQKIKMCEYGFPESKNVSTEAKDLIKGILVCDPKRRMSPDDILNHPFLTNYEIPHSLQCQYLERVPSKDFIDTYNKKKRNNKPEPRPIQFNDTVSIQNSSKTSKQVHEPQGAKKTQIKMYKPKYRLGNYPCDYIIKSQSVKTQITQIESEKKTKKFDQDCKTQKKDKKIVPIQIPTKIGLKQIQKSAFSQFRKGFNQENKLGKAFSGVAIRQKLEIPSKNKIQAITQPKISNKSRVKPPFHIKKKQFSSPYTKIMASVIDWIKSQQKCGIAYLLQNGFCGILFNDNTKILTNWIFKECIYQKFGQVFHLKVQGHMQSIDGSAQQVDRLYKKLDLLGYFLQKFKNRDAINKYSTLRAQEKVPDPSFIITKFLQNKTIKIFLKKDREIQCIFDDGSEFLVDRKLLKLTYESSTNEKTTTLIPSQQPFTKQRIFRVKMKQVCKLLRSQTKIWRILQKFKVDNRKFSQLQQIQQSFQKQNDKSTNVEKQLKGPADQTKWGYEQVFNL